MGDFDKKVDDFVEKYEKGFDKHVPKAVDAVEKVASGANRFSIGCITVLGNLFFLGFCLWGLFAAYKSFNLSRDGETTIGIVTSLAESSSGEGGCCVYSPVIEFEANGQTYTFEGDNASYPPAYRVGEEVRVIYDPADPSTALINKPSERWLFPVIIIPAMIFGSVIFTAGMVCAWRRGEYIWS